MTVVYLGLYNFLLISLHFLQPDIDIKSLLGRKSCYILLYNCHVPSGVQIITEDGIQETIDFYMGEYREGQRVLDLTLQL